MSFSSYDQINRDNILPSCYNCSTRDEMELVDVVSDNHNKQGTIPVWRCRKCGKLRGERNWSIQNSLDSYNSTTSSDPTLIAQNYNFQETLQRQPFWQNSVARAEQLVSKINDLETRLKAAEELAADPLHELRKRVNSFQLS